MEHPTHCIGSACVLPDGCRFLRKHSEIIEQKRFCAPLFATVSAIELTKSSEGERRVRRGGGCPPERRLEFAVPQNRALPGTRYTTERGAVWDLPRHGIGRCPRFASLRNEVLKAQRRALATARQRALAKSWRGVRRWQLLAGGRWQVLAGCWGRRP